MIEEPLQRHFTLRAPAFERSAGWISDPGLLQAITSAVRLPPSARLLDVCCGTGIVGAAFRELVGRVEGLDLTEAMLAIARKHLDAVHRGSAHQMPFAAGAFDAVVSRQAWHLLEDPALAVREMARVLAPGGHLIYAHAVPYGAADEAWMRQVFLARQPLATGFLLESDLRHLLSKAGLERVCVTEHLLWESIDRWLDVPDLSQPTQEQIRACYRNIPAETAAVHPVEFSTSGSIRDQWRWVVISATKPRGDAP